MIERHQGRQAIAQAGRLSPVGLFPLSGARLGRKIGDAARFHGCPMIVFKTEPGGGRVDGLSDSHDSAERAVRCERVPRREGHPFVHQFYSVGAPSVLSRHM